MGLDQYLRARKYVSGYKFQKEEKKKQYNDLLKLAGFEKPPCPESPGAHIEINVAYWRKCNQVHAWFLALGDGEDNCKSIYVKRKSLVELRDICARLLRELKTHRGLVQNGAYAGPETGGKMVPNMEPGEIITNPELAKELLPTQGGFFFGSTNYDNYYLDDLRLTVKQLDAVLDNPAFDDHWEFEYVASW